MKESNLKKVENWIKNHYAEVVVSISILALFLQACEPALAPPKPTPTDGEQKHPTPTLVKTEANPTKEIAQKPPEKTATVEAAPTQTMMPQRPDFKVGSGGEYPQWLKNAIEQGVFIQKEETLSSWMGKVWCDKRIGLCNVDSEAPSFIYKPDINDPENPDKVMVLLQSKTLFEQKKFTVPYWALRQNGVMPIDQEMANNIIDQYLKGQVQAAPMIVDNPGDGLVLANQNGWWVGVNSEVNDKGQTISVKRLDPETGKWAYTLAARPQDARFIPVENIQEYNIVGQNQIPFPYDIKFLEWNEAVVEDGVTMRGSHIFEAKTGKPILYIERNEKGYILDGRDSDGLVTYHYGNYFTNMLIEQLGFAKTTIDGREVILAVVGIHQPDGKIAKVVMPYDPDFPRKRQAGVDPMDPKIPLERKTPWDIWFGWQGAPARPIAGKCFSLIPPELCKITDPNQRQVMETFLATGMWNSNGFQWYQLDINNDGLQIDLYKN